MNDLPPNIISYSYQNSKNAMRAAFFALATKYNAIFFELCNLIF